MPPVAALALVAALTAGPAPAQPEATPPPATAPAQIQRADCPTAEALLEKLTPHVRLVFKGFIGDSKEGPIGIIVVQEADGKNWGLWLEDRGGHACPILEGPVSQADQGGAAWDIVDGPP